ncbi:hypothetical protein L1987_04219 [Smallanthus sonchifolius]|uniref:Uncharacterized protein n=1 Tax=Smallanthus sonchifolius TaxID=185202 RepID=A0ACB9KCQ1_9ASTR|nr:hypothetical protein L1987_04219 [Smallanthus sonchifolius]
MNHHAMVRRSGASTPRPLNHRHHNYYNNHHQFDFGDKPKIFKAPTIPCTSQQHIDPKPYTTYLQKNRKGTSATGKKGVFPARRKSSADLNDRNSSGGSSSRYLLNNTNTFVDDLKDFDDACNAGALVVSEQAWPDDDDLPVIKKSLSSRLPRGDDSRALVKSRSSSVRLLAQAESPGSKSSKPHQVVELRVSIHCKGCEGKVRKHISRMEGVKSFHIDLESKKVTVVGDVTPLSVLASISKVKNTQLWPSPPSSSSPRPLIAVGY